MKKTNIFAGLFGLALSIYAIVTASGFPENNSATDPGAGFFPIIMGVFTGVLCLVLIVLALMGKGPDIDKQLHLTSGMKRAFLAIALFVLYCVLFKPLGFILDTVWLLFVGMLLMQNRRYVLMAVISVIVPIIIYVIFSMLLYVQLPAGLLSWLL